MLPDIQHAIRLQVLDDRVTALTKEIATLPKHIAEIEKKLDGHQRRLEHDKAALIANQKDRKHLEGEIQAHDQKISKLKSQMMEAKNNEQYRAFQHEIDHLDGVLFIFRISALKRDFVLRKIRKLQRAGDW